MLSERMTEALNKQINNEIYSAYLYLSMSAYSTFIGLKGFANWFMVQYQEDARARGEAPRLVLEIMKNKFEMHVMEPPLLLKYAPDQVGLEKCREFGRKIVERLMLPT